MFVLEIYLTFSSNLYWIFDTGYGTNVVLVCRISSGIGGYSGEIYLRAGNESWEDVLAVGICILYMPIGLLLELSVLYHISSLTRNFISVSCMARCGFTFVFMNTRCYVYKNDVLYYIAEINNGLYVFYNNSPICNVTNKTT